MGQQDRQPKTKPTNPVTPATNTQVNTTVGNYIAPITGQNPAPTTKDYVDAVQTTLANQNPSPGVASKAAKAIEVVRLGVDIYQAVKQNQAQDAVVDIAAELHCLNEKIGKITFVAGAQVDFHRNLLRVGAELLSVLRLVTQAKSESFLLDPIRLNSPDPEQDSDIVRSYNQPAYDIFDEGLRNEIPKCQKEIDEG